MNVPVAILLAGVLVAGAVFFPRAPAPAENPAAAGLAGEERGATLRPVSAADHILGNPGAGVIIVEYSDLECPFCKVFHNTMQQLMNEYGKRGDLAWVYRHFPLEGLHPKAPKEAEATECVAEQGGNDAFWKFTDRVFEITPSNNGLDLTELPKIAEGVGLNREAFEKCLESGKYAEKVQADYNDALAAGGQGTPYSVIISGENRIPVDGAQPYAAVKSIIENLLAEARGPAGQQAVPILSPQ